MNVTFKIKLEEGDNKNFLVFISTELTKKLNFELMSTSTLRWEFKRNNAELAIQHGFYNQEVYEVVRNKGSYREEVVKETRNVLDIQAIPYIKNNSKLPIIVDPSHASGESYMVESMSKAALVAGCDGLIIEVHTNPEESKCDSNQTIDIETLKKILDFKNKIKDLD